MKNLIIVLSLIIATSVAAQTTYYISSSSGNDANNGTSSATPWKTLKSYTRGSGNTYRFKDDDTFYFNIPPLPASGTTLIKLTDYGTGNKPVISKLTKIKSIAWVLNSTNVWKANIRTAGNITGWLPNETNCGFIKVDGVIHGARKYSVSRLTSQWQFYCDFASTIYVYSTVNPSSIASNIEVSNSDQCIGASSYQTISNVKIIGCSKTGFIPVHLTNITVKNVDITEMGGEYKSITDSTRQGNGLSIYDGGTNILVDSCFITNNWDEALSMQSHDATAILYTNCVYSNNITDSNAASFNPTIQAGRGFVNCRVFNNIFKHDGNSWSLNARPKHNEQTTFMSNGWVTSENDLVVENNIIICPLEGVYYKNIPPYISRNNNITIDSNIYIEKNFIGGNPNLYPWKLADHAAFVSATGHETGSTWHSCSDTVSPSMNIYYRDLDSDGYGNISDTISSTSQPPGYVLNNSDCNDSNASINPGAVEISDGIDNNCNGLIDEGMSYQIFYRDADGDGYGNPTDTVMRISVPVGYISIGRDCNDSNINIHPGAKEICGNHIDDNCDGYIDGGGCRKRRL